MQLVVAKSTTAVERQLAAARSAVPTYTGAHDGRFVHREYRATVGYGIVAFRTAREGLQTWHAHDQPGLSVFPEREPVAEGGTYLLVFGPPLLAIAAPCRVTAVVDEPWHYAFTYATLPGHPEVGEETFELAVQDEEVVFRVESTSKGASPLAGSPAGRFLQRSTTRRYLRALADYVRRAAPLG